MSDRLFELKNVRYAYRGQPALDGMSLCLRRGERVALLGANGSGKSTLLRLLDALYFAQGGEVTAFGEVLSEAALADDRFNYDFRRRVGLVFQNPDVQLFNPTVLDELAFGPLQLGWPKDEIIRRVEAMLAQFAIAHLRQRAPHRLSGGEKKRVALASVLIIDPEVVLLDEPTASLDPESQADVVRYLLASRGSGRTIVTATHDLHIVEDIADFVYVLDAGRVAGAGTPAQILADRELLRRTHLEHAHRHVHADGQIHAHARVRRAPHEHEYADPATAGAGRR